MIDPRIVWTNGDGRVEIFQPAPNGRRDGETEADWLLRLRKKVVPRSASHVAIVEGSTLPQRREDREFRSAWRFDGGRLTIPIGPARDAWRDRMRRARAPLLAALDIEYQRADERGDANAKRDIAARKQALRDVPADPAIDAAKTPEQLKAVWPACLGANGQNPSLEMADGI
jgi:hypothetical protein